MERSKQKSLAEDGAVLIEGFLNSEHWPDAEQSTIGVSRTPVLSPLPFFLEPKNRHTMTTPIRSPRKNLTNWYRRFRSVSCSPISGAQKTSGTSLKRSF